MVLGSELQVSYSRSSGTAWLVADFSDLHMGGNPKIGGYPPKSSILIGFSIIFTIHFGVPLLWDTTI